MVEIIQAEHPVLREVAKPIKHGAIKSEKITTILHDMSVALASQPDGVAIAAPQIGIPLRIFLVSGNVFEKPESGGTFADLVFINPKIVKQSKKTKEMEEGCLSLRWYYGKVRRAQNVTIEAYNEHGEKITRGAGGLLAQVFQHEIDHLDGILFTDKATHLENLPPQQYA